MVRALAVDVRRPREVQGVAPEALTHVFAVGALALRQCIEIVVDVRHRSLLDRWYNKYYTRSAERLDSCPNVPDVAVCGYELLATRLVQEDKVSFGDAVVVEQGRPQRANGRKGTIGVRERAQR